MNKFKNTCLGLMAAAAFFTAVPACEAASIDVPENVFQWVQSTSIRSRCATRSIQTGKSISVR